MRKSSTTLRTLRSDCRGVVFIEFILAFVPVFILFLGVIQLALLAGAKLVVQHAAIAGARSASVVLDDDPQHYDGAERGDISASKADASTGWQQSLAKLLGESKSTNESIALGGRRMAAITRAVHVPLAALAPDPLLAASIMVGVSTNVRDALGTMPATRLLFGLAFYVPLATAVTFPTAPGSLELHEGRVEPDGNLTVRVTHIVPCVVPVAAALICDKLGFSPETATEESESRERARHELRLAPGASQQRLFLFARVALLQAEATVPAQSAPYLYLSQRKDAS